MSTEPVYPLNLPDPPKPEPPPLELTNPTVGGGSPPTEPDPFGSTGGFPPQKPEPPNSTIKSTKSDEIERFSDKELLEIHQIRSDLAKIYSRFDRFSQILARSRPIWPNIGTGGETQNRTDTKPKPNGLEPDDLTIKTGWFRF